MISEKYERIIIRRKQKRKIRLSNCLNCNQKVEWLTPAEVGALTGLKINDIRQAIAQRNFDTLETKQGEFFICSESVFKTLDKSK